MNPKLLIILILLAVSTIKTDSSAAQPPPQPPADIALSSSREKASPVKSSGSTIAVLALILCVIIVAYPALRKLGQTRQSNSGPFELIHRSQLDPRTTLFAVRCGSRLLILGGTGQQITTLSEITDPDEIEMVVRPNWATQPEAESNSELSPARQRLHQMRDRLNAKLAN